MICIILSDERWKLCYKRQLNCDVSFLSWHQGCYPQMFSKWGWGGGEQKEIKCVMIGKKEISKQLPPAPTTSTMGPCCTIIQISRIHRHWNLPSTQSRARLFKTLLAKRSFSQWFIKSSGTIKLRGLLFLAEKKMRRIFAVQKGKKCWVFSYSTFENLTSL